MVKASPRRTLRNPRATSFLLQDRELPRTNRRTSPRRTAGSARESCVFFGVVKKEGENFHHRHVQEEREGESAKQEKTKQRTRVKGRADHQLYGRYQVPT